MAVEVGRSVEPARVFGGGAVQALLDSEIYLLGDIGRVGSEAVVNAIGNCRCM